MTRAELVVASLLCAALVFLNAACVASVLGWVHGPRKVLEGDHFRYLEMARGAEGKPELARQPPYCWRILAPFVARTLARTGLGVNAAFYLETNVFLFAFLLVLYVFWRRIGFDPLAAAAGVTWSGLMQGAVRWYEYQYWMSDAPALFFVALAFLLTQTGQSVALALTSLPAVLSRESYVFVFPYHFLHLARRRAWWPALVRTAAIAAGPVVLLVLVQRLILPSEPNDLAVSVADTLGFRWRHRGDNQAYVTTVGSLGVLFPLMLLFPERAAEEVRRHFDAAAYLLITYLTLAIANNTERMLAYGLPVVVPAALWSAEALAREARLPRAAVLGAATLFQALFWSRVRFHGEAGLSMYQPPDALVSVAMAAFWVTARLVLALRASRGRP
ncbi:MAG TPA: hypothetical protein VGQ78_03865 [Vicinamibacteria bacterium]|nr:hypothetical protein [Vicinamibacteria bacterium]